MFQGFNFKDGMIDKPFFFQIPTDYRVERTHIMLNRGFRQSFYFFHVLNEVLFQSIFLSRIWRLFIAHPCHLFLMNTISARFLFLLYQDQSCTVYVSRPALRLHSIERIPVVRCFFRDSFIHFPLLLNFFLQISKSEHGLCLF